MFGPRFGLLAIAATCLSLVSGQSQWPAGQVNTTLCMWRRLRAHVLRDTVYMDGGRIWWIPGLDNGEYGAVVADDNPLGVVFTLNFSKPFNTGPSENITRHFGTLSKVTEGFAVNNLAPTYHDGAMLGNHEQWFLYGGLLRRTTQFSEPAGNTVLEYQGYQYGPKKDSFRPGFLYEELPASTSRYLAYGGEASAPSENMAWYFSGLRSPLWGPIYDSSTNVSTQANNVSSTLIQLNMTTQLAEEWQNKTLPNDISGRADPELAWVPVGEKGILVVLGGVLFPDFYSVNGKSPNEAASRASSPQFMSTIDVYDVAKEQWYRQPTTGDIPGQLSSGCTVVAPAQDQSSFNIYYYGGYEGLDSSQPFSDVVWVLSVPSFTWTKLTDGTGQGRAGSKCFMPYPDQMFVIGGDTQRTGAALSCLVEPIRVFNVSSGEWLSSYDPAKWSNYTVPAAVVQKIGGSPTGGATATSPSPSWASSGLAAVFATKYPTDKIVNYWPYNRVDGDNTNPNLPPDPNNGGGGGGVPSFLPPVLGVVLGLMFVTMIAVLILLWRRRGLFRRRGGQSEAGTEDTNGHRIMTWIRGQNTDAKTVTSDVTPSTPGDFESVSTYPQQPMQQHHHHQHQQRSIPEMMANETPAELMDTSMVPELNDTGLTHVDVINRFSRAPPGSSVNNNGSYQYSSSGIDGVDHHTRSISPSSPASSHAYLTNDGSQVLPQTQISPGSELYGSPGVSSPNNAHNIPSSAAAAAAAATTPDITITEGTQQPARGYIPSGVSGLSERDRAHLRTISDTTVSSVNSGERNMRSPEPGELQPHAEVAEYQYQQQQQQQQQQPYGGHHHYQQQHQRNDSQASVGTGAGAVGGGELVTSPEAVSPPTAGIMNEAGDYLSARPPGGGPQTGGSPGAGISPTSPLRRSVFHESREDMNGGRQ